MAHANTAPVELVLIRFPKNNFRGEVAAALSDLVKNNIIKVIDILFVAKDKEGNIDVVEISDLEKNEYEAFTPIISRETGNLLNEKDAQELSKEMENDSSAGLMLFEDTWAKDLAEAVDRAGGNVVLNERVPRAVLDRYTE